MKEEVRVVKQHLHDGAGRLRFQQRWDMPHVVASITLQIASPHIVVCCTLNILQKLAAICILCAIHSAYCVLLLKPAGPCRQLAQLTNQLGYLTETTLRKLAGMTWNQHAT